MSTVFLPEEVHLHGISLTHAHPQENETLYLLCWVLLQLVLQEAFLSMINVLPIQIELDMSN